MGIEPRSPALQADSLPDEPPGKPIVDWVTHEDKGFILECCALLCWVAHHVQLFAHPWPVACQPPLFMGIVQARGGCHVLFQEIFPTQGWNPGLPHCRQILYWLSPQGRWINLVCSCRTEVVWGQLHQSLGKLEGHRGCPGISWV